MANPLWKDRLMALRLWPPLAPLILVVAALVFGIDQTHKWWMLVVFAIGARDSVAILPFLDITLVWNRGISYGLFPSHDQAPLIVVGLLVCAGLWLWACRTGKGLVAASLALIIGGALSNILDRLARGAVADFFHFHVGQFSWYVFNLADVAVVAGVALLLYESVSDRASTGVTEKPDLGREEPS